MHYLLMPPPSALEDDEDKIKIFILQQILTNANKLKYCAKKFLLSFKFYLPSCLDQETAKEPCGFRVKLSPATHLPLADEIIHTIS